MTDTAVSAPRPMHRRVIDRVDREWLASSAAGWWGLGILLLVGAVFLFLETRGTTWWLDEWTWALYQRGSSLHTFLEAHNGHFVLAPLVIYKVLFATAGLRHYTVFRIVLIACQLGVVALVYTYAQRRVEPFLALIIAALLMFFGPGWQDILWPFQICWLIAISCGIGALLLLDREDTPGRIGASVLLTIAVASVGLGVSIVFGVLIELLLLRRWRQLWVIAVPVVVYGLWTLGYQHSSITAHAISHSPDFGAEIVAATMAAMFGLGTPIQHGLDVDSGTLFQWGPPLAVAAAVLLLWRLLQLRRVPPRVWTFVAILCSFWLLAGLNPNQASQPFESRYLYIGAVFISLLAVELIRGVVLAWAIRAAIAVIALAVLITNIGVMRDAATFLRSQAQLTRAQIGALDITRNIVPTDFATGPLNAIAAGPYFATERDIGSPRARPDEIATDPEPVREQVDSELESIHRFGLRPASGPIGSGPSPAVDAAVAGSVRRTGACVVFTPANFTGGTNPQPFVIVQVPGSGLRMSVTGGAATVSYRRFADAFQELGVLQPGGAVDLRINADLSSQPWHVQILPAGRATVCSL
jgi:hypothetical protein